MQRVETNLHNFCADAALPKLSNQYVYFRDMKIFFLLSFPDKILFINKIFLFVPPMLDERENWISEELMLTWISFLAYSPSSDLPIFVLTFHRDCSIHFLRT